MNQFLLYVPCIKCGSQNLKLVIDTQGSLWSDAKPGEIRIMCMACGRHSLKENWNRLNENIVRERPKKEE